MSGSGGGGGGGGSGDGHDDTHLGNLSAAATVAVGILVGLLSTSIQSVGLTLQRKSHQLEDEKEDELVRRPPYRRRRWQIGMFMFVIANLVGSTIQITTLPLPVLSTLQASGLVFNTICASIVLREPFTRWSFIGTALIAAGAILIALFGAVAEPSHNLAQHLELLHRKQFIIWMLGTFFLIAVILLAILCINRLHRHSQPPILRLARGFAFGAVSSILSAHSLLIAKSAVELLVRTIVDRRNQFDRWQSWFILVMLVFFALSQLYFLHRGLKVVSTSVLYPFVFCIYNIIAILDGLIYFRQASRLPPLHGGLIALGTCILLSGVFALSWRLDDQRYTAPPPEAHNLLTPGMGLVEDTTTEDEHDVDADNSSITSADEESGLPFAGHPSERTPLLRQDRQRPRPTLRLAMPPGDFEPLHVSKPRRTAPESDRPTPSIPHRQTSEAADIWDELQDSHPTPISTSRAQGGPPGSPITYFPRRASAIGLGGRRIRTRFRDGDERQASSPESERRHSRSRKPSVGHQGRTNGTAKDIELGSSRKRSKTLAGGAAGATETRAAPSRNGDLPTSLWRERDRERRRRSGWSGVGFSGILPGSGRRSSSSPWSAHPSSRTDPHTEPLLGSRTSLRRRSETPSASSFPAATTATAATARGSRAASLGGWLRGLLPWQEQPDEGENPDSTSPDRRGT